MSAKKQTSSILPPKNNSKTTVKKVIKVKENIKSKVRTKAQPNNKNTVSAKLKLLITIVARNKAEFYLDLIQSFDVNMQCVLIGQGTADKSTLGLLGLTDTDKAVILSVIQDKKIPDALSTLDNRFNSIKGGKGVAWTIPLTSVIGVLIYGFLSNNREAVKEGDNGKQ